MAERRERPPRKGTQGRSKGKPKPKIHLYFPEANRNNSHFLNMEEARQLFALLGIKAKPHKPGYYWHPKIKAFDIIEAIESDRFARYYGVEFDIPKVAKWLFNKLAVDRSTRLALAVRERIRMLGAELRNPNYRERRKDIEYRLQRLHEFLYYLENPEAIQG